MMYDDTPVDPKEIKAKVKKAHGNMPKKGEGSKLVVNGFHLGEFHIVNGGTNEDEAQYAKTMCVMQLASVIAGREYTDHPPCVPQVLTSAMISWNDHTTDAVREQMKDLLPDLIGSNLVNKNGTSSAATNKSITKFVAAQYINHLLPWLLDEFGPKRETAFNYAAILRSIDLDKQTRQQIIRLLKDVPPTCHKMTREQVLAATGVSVLHQIVWDFIAGKYFTYSQELADLVNSVVIPVKRESEVIERVKDVFRKAAVYARQESIRLAEARGIQTDEKLRAQNRHLLNGPEVMVKS